MNKIWKGRFCLAVSLPMLLIGAPGQAEEHSGTKDEQAACTPDVFRLCLFEIPNEARIVACLNRNVESLSPECHDVIAGPSPKSKSKPKR